MIYHDANTVTELAVIVIYMTAWYLVARALRRFDVADIAWGPGFIVAVLTVAAIGSPNLRAYLVMALVTVWGMRLSLHVYLRNRGKPEDARYKAWRQEWGKNANIRAFLQIFMLQGLLLLVISLPITSVMMAGSSAFTLLDATGLFIWVMGFLFEAIGDWQLLGFKKGPAHKGRIIKTGLWSFSRHPNYFGEVTLWWGIYLIALSSGASWPVIIGPLTITFLILKVSGIPMFEKKTLLIAAGAFSPIPYLLSAPFSSLWMVMLWVNLAATINVSTVWLRDATRWARSSEPSADHWPITAAKLGAMTRLPDPGGLLATSIVWAVSLPLLYGVAEMFMVRFHRPDIS